MIPAKITFTGNVTAQEFFYFVPSCAKNHTMNLILVVLLYNNLTNIREKNETEISG